ncbi:GNAT family N-acetyltransferase [Pleionea sp. CnH1-48]|uniref:GNAT family N-acetyltransferase n=1 Tax=Pleionea sp. CnH1-48 TaxID=2954494 RepID=UPI002097066B|nr:GNAT family N-acetyltransferase [Pleionea sp. CnH1-48]MCO7227317.1 GNAT family N-acetyltransferase [Pleionea sp. CnH1-48]
MSHVTIPIVESERLLLRAPSVEDFELYQKFYTDGKASSAYGGPISPADTWNRLKADLGSWYLLGFGVWVVQDKASGECLGTCGFWQGVGWPRELTWWLLPEARGKGIAREASQAAIAHAYGSMGWNKVETYMNDENIPARRLTERLGGVKDRRELFPDGLTRDIFLFPKPE